MSPEERQEVEPPEGETPSEAGKAKASSEASPSDASVEDASVPAEGAEEPAAAAAPNTDSGTKGVGDEAAKPKRARKPKPKAEEAEPAEEAEAKPAEKPKRARKPKTEAAVEAEVETKAQKSKKEEAEAEAPEPEKPAAPAPRRQRGAREPDLPPPLVRAQAKYVRSSARKARLVCDHIRGKSVDEARAILAHTPRAVARDWSKLLESAVANAEHNHELVGEDLYIKAVHADEGPTLKRFRPRAMGRATRIRKRTSHLTILLTPKD